MTPLPRTLPKQTRTVALSVRAGSSSSDGSLDVSLSSEEPVRRFFGQEILSHARKAVDFVYARHGLPLLLNHDTDTQIGIIENVRLKDGRLVGTARPGNHPDATHVFQDMKDGVRRHLSIGYLVHEVTLVKSDDQGDTYRADRWTPVECSAVPVPADVTVGVGRANAPEYPVRLNHSNQSPAPLAAERRTRTMEQDNGVTITNDHDAERQTYFTTITNLAKITQRPDWERLAMDAIGRGLTVRQFQGELADRAVASAASTVSTYELNAREQKQYSLCRAIAAASGAIPWDKAGFEREVSNDLAKRAPTNNGGFFFPLGLQTRASVTGQVAATASLGGAGVQTTIMDMIELLRVQSIVQQAGARMLTGLTANITFPRQITATQVAWTGENPSSGNTNTNMTFDTVALTPKTAMISTAASRQLIVQMAEGAEEVVREDLSRVAAIELDRVALNGLGSSNQPRGLFQMTVTSTVTTLGADGRIPTWADAVAFETTLAEDNAPLTSPWAWVTTPGVRGILKQTLRNTVAGSSYVWSDDNKINGYKALVSNNVPSGLTAGTSTTIASAMALGAWSEMLIGTWGNGAEILVDPYTVASQNMVQFHLFLMMDVNVRHGQSFAVTKAALIA